MIHLTMKSYPDYFLKKKHIFKDIQTNTQQAFVLCTSFERFGISLPRFNQKRSNKQMTVRKTAKIKSKHTGKTQLKQIINKYYVVLILIPAKFEYSFK